MLTDRGFEIARRARLAARRVDHGCTPWKDASEQPLITRPKSTFQLRLYVAGPDAEIDSRVPKPEADLRGTPGRAVRDRDHRPARESTARARRPDSGRAHARAAAAGTDQEDHRRPVEHRARARGPRPPASPVATRSHETAQRRTRDIRAGRAGPPERTYVLRLYVTGMTPRSARAVENVRAICDEHLAGRTISRSSTSTSSPCSPRASRSSPRRR